MPETSNSQTLRYRLARLAAFGLAPLALAACGGGDGGPAGPGAGGVVNLTEEEQVLGAALLGADVARSAQGMAEGMAEDESDGGIESSGGASFGAAGVSSAQAGEVPVEFECGEGDFRMEEGNLIDLHAQAFPEPFVNAGSLPPGQDDSAATADYAHDMHLRSDCVFHQDGEESYRFVGSIDIAQLENLAGTNGRVVMMAMGGLTGTGRDDAPDLQHAVEIAGTFNDGSGPQTLSSSYRARVYSCEGCVDGDLENFTGDAALDATTVAFMDIDVDLPGGRLSYRAGDSLEPFVMQTAHAGVGAAEVEMRGLLAFKDHASGCGFDVTYTTTDPLRIEGYDQGGIETVDGKMDVTLNATGTTYTVAFSSGGATVYDAGGNVVTPAPSADAQACGFMAGEG